MSQKEQLSFEKKIAEDADLASAVEETRLTNEALHYANLAVLKESIGQDIKKIPQRTNSRIKKAALISASLLLAGSLAYVLTPEKDIETVSKPKIEETKKQVKKKTETAKLDNTNKIEAVKSTSESKKEEKENNPSEKKKKTEETITVVTKTAESKEKKTSTASKTEEKTEKKTAAPTTASEAKEKQEPAKVATKEVIPQKTEKATIPCDRTFEVSSTASCKEEANGTITIHLTETEDYKFQLDGYKESGNQFYDVAAGKHQLVINYAECTFQKTVTVPEKWCGFNKSFSFNPEYGEKWEIQYPSGEEGTFTVYNARGREVYKTTFGNGNEYWDGNDINGNPAPVGSYFALIKYSNNQVERVELTIVR